MHEYLTQRLAHDNRNTLLLGKRHWVAIPDPQQTVESLQTALLAVKARLQVQSRERGDLRDSFLTIRDLFALGLIDAEGLLVRPQTYTLSSGVTWSSGEGSPEGVVSAPVGSFYSNITGGASTAFYVKETGTDLNTGWVAK